MERQYEFWKAWNKIIINETKVIKKNGSNKLTNKDSFLKIAFGNISNKGNFIRTVVKLYKRLILIWKMPSQSLLHDFL